MSRYAAKCRGCNATIVWGIDGDGKRIPLDPKPPVYAISGYPSHLGEGAEVSRADRETYMVSHFATCPNANQFSGRGREAPGADTPRGSPV